MRLLQVVFGILWVLGYLGNGILFLYIEWSFVRQSFIQVFNPFLQFQVLGVLLTTPLFWVFLAMALVGHYATARIEGYLEQGAKRTKIDAKTVVSPLSQTLQEKQPSPSSSLQSEPPCTVPTQPHSNQVSEPEPGSVEPQIKLLEWAIQSSQKVWFSYEEQYGERSNFTITPIDFKTVEETLCLEGYHQGRAKRIFAVKRMRDLKIVPANEPNSRRDISQEVLAPHTDVESKVSSAPQPSSSDTTRTENLDAQGKQRIYIKFRIDELEKITALEWNNAKGLSEIHYELEFRSRRKAVDLRERIAARLTQLQITNTGSHTSLIDTFTDGDGILSHYGYKVGMNGLRKSERWEILDTIFLRPLLRIDDAAYLNEWGEPNSAKRLQKLTRSIAAFTRLAKGRSRGDFSKAIQDWETDLAYLKRTYYNNRFSFQYPRT